MISKPELVKLVKDMSGLMAMSGTGAGKNITEDELVESGR